MYLTLEEQASYESLYGSLADQSDEEELFYHRGGDSAERGKSEEELPKPGGLVGVLGLLLQLLDGSRVRETRGV